MSASAKVLVREERGAFPEDKKEGQGSQSLSNERRHGGRGTIGSKEREK